jgi:hypothetical protein
MNRQNKIDSLLGRGADDERRLALDQIDQTARETNTFGSKEHREKRDETERKHDRARRSFEALTDAELDQTLADEDPVINQDTAARA